MNSTHSRQEGDVRHEHGNGNGHDLNAGLVRKWLNIPANHQIITCYELLGITPQKAEVPQRVNDVELDQLALLTPYLQDERTRDDAERIALELEKAKELLVDEKRRLKYNRTIFAKHPELAALYAAEETYAAAIQCLPQTICPRQSRSTSVLSGIAAWTRKSPAITVAAAGTLTLLAGIFAMRRQSTFDAETSVAVEKKLPDDAPELNRVPVAPDPAPVQKKIESPKSSVPVRANAPEADITVVPPPSIPVAPLPSEKIPAPPPTPSATPTPEKPVEEAPIQQEKTPERKPVPSAEELEKYSDLLKSPTLAKFPVQDIVEQAQKSRDAAQQSTLLRIAMQKARAAHDLDGAMSVLHAKQEIFDDDPAILQDKIAVILEAAELEDRDVAKVMLHVYHVTHELCDSDDLPAAKRFLSKLQSRSSSKQNRSSTNRQQLAAMVKFVSRLEATYKRLNVEDHLQTPEEFPDDPKANGVLGEYRCLEQGDWSRTEYLRKSDNPDLKALADRVDRLSALPAEELLQFAKDLRDRQPTKPGLLALAVECCDLGIRKAVEPIMVTRLKDLRLTVIREHGLILPLVQHPATLDTQKGISGTDFLPAPETAPLPGAVPLLTGNLESFRKRSRIVRDVCEISQRNGALELKCGSPYNEWVSLIHIPANPEALAIVKSGKPYVFTVTFSRTKGARTNEKLPQGGTGFLIPLPTKKHMSVLWDGNMHKDWWGKNMLRSGIYPETPYFWSREKKSPAHFDHQKPLIKEDGREYICQVSVRSDGRQICIDAILAENGRSQAIASVSFVAPMDTDSSTYLLREGKNPLPIEPVVGFGAGGGTMKAYDATLAPLPPQRR
ncbi:MAG: hypothetical protein PHN33_00900 [Candidatus Peribacteraceae bacterium]|nr:hypothetical protein [Candidatus Peribacteraceae bacterium]